MERVGQPISLQEANFQEIQLELLRRARFNNLVGERVALSLIANRDLWESAIFDRGPVWSPEYSNLPRCWLYKLRDLPRGQWNSDKLFLLTPSIEEARQIERLADCENWGGDLHIYDDPDEVAAALGTRKDGRVIVTIWWD